MKILFDNLLLSGGAVAIAQDSNFPASNLKSPFLKKRFQSINTTDTITCTLGTPALISSVYTGYSNATITIKAYFNSVLLYSITGTHLEFTPTVIDVVTVELVATTPAYLGGIGIGLPFEINPPESFWAEGYEDRSLVSESQSGQVLNEYVEPFRKYQFKFPGLTRDKAREFQDEYRRTGLGVPMFVDPSTDGLEPLYCRLTGEVGANKNKRQYDIQINLLEAR